MVRAATGRLSRYRVRISGEGSHPGGCRWRLAGGRDHNLSAGSSVGFGLALPLARKCCELHGLRFGAVRVEADGDGHSCTIRFPGFAAILERQRKRSLATPRLGTHRRRVLSTSAISGPIVGSPDSSRVAANNRAPNRRLIMVPSVSSGATDMRSSISLHAREIRRHVPHPPLKDYSAAVAQAIAWLGDRYLLARPVSSI